MNKLYPHIVPFAAHWMDVGGDHRIYFEACGNPLGLPVLFLHGGPGSGCGDGHRRYFDPAHFHIILMDQRGCGRSTPLGETQANTTDCLVQDMEIVRQALGIERWILFGGSWGATLAICYAQRFPKSVSAMVLRGTFLARSQDIDWFFGHSGAARVFPDAYDDFVGQVPLGEHDDLIAAYHRRVHGPDKKKALAAANAWTAWGGSGLATWNLQQRGEQNPTDSMRTLAKVRIETHFAVNRYFIGDRPLLDEVNRLSGVPVLIIHGRMDLVCPVDGAWTLHQAIPESRLRILPNAGHLLVEAAMIDALVGEMNRLAVEGG